MAASLVNKRYKYCIVPGCLSTTVSTPDKLFLHVPPNKKRRKMWWKAMRRDGMSDSTVCFCCEDHFDLEKDISNLMQVKLMNFRAFLGGNVVPHKFDCQTVRPTAHTKTDGWTKRKKLDIIDDVCVEHAGKDEIHSSLIDLCANDHLMAVEIEEISSNVTKVSKGTQHSDPVTEAAISPVKGASKDVALSPNNSKRRVAYTEVYTDSDSEINEDSSSDSSQTSSSESSEFHLAGSFQKLVEKKPMLYLGVPQHSYFIISLLVKVLNIPAMFILVCFQKIRTNQPFEMIGDLYCISKIKSNKIFKDTIPKIVPLLKELIVMPEQDTSKRRLPIPFRTRFRNVAIIIDCLEIKIQKPSNAVQQAPTWSEDKKCNTLKYLIGCTLDGLICYVSTGYGGKTSDLVMFRDCGILDELKPGMHIMAGRRFEEVEEDIVKKQCCLVRPPSAAGASQLSKTDVCLEKQVASLPIHLQRVNARLRQFSLLAPHSCVNNKLVSMTDSFTIIACALVNLQESLIK